MPPQMPMCMDGSVMCMNSTGGGMDMGGMSMTMPTYFATGGWTEAESVYILFKWWKSNTYATYIASLIGVFILGFIQEGLAALNVIMSERLREVYKGSSSSGEHVDARLDTLMDESKGKEFDTESTSCCEHLLERLGASLAYGVYLGWHFLAMLIFMTYNTGLCILLLLGVMVGHFVFKTGPKWQRQGRAAAQDCHGPRRNSSFLAE